MRNMCPRLQLEAGLCLDVVGVADAVAVDEAVDGVEHHPGVLPQPPVIQLHPVDLEVELQTKVREIFTIMDRAASMAFSWWIAKI